MGGMTGYCNGTAAAQGAIYVSGTYNTISTHETINIGVTAYNITGDNNKILGCTDYGAQGLAAFYVKARYVTIANCRQYYAWNYSILVNNVAQDVLIQGNTLDSTRGPACIYLQAAYSNNIKKISILGNNIYAPQQHGIYVESAVDSIISNNFISEVGQKTTNTYDAIKICNYANGLEVSGNIIKSSGAPVMKYGIEDTANDYNLMYLNNQINGAGTSAFGLSSNATRIVTSGNYRYDASAGMVAVP